MEDWVAFEALKARLLATGEFTAADTAHRLLYGSMEVPLDLVPFGGVEGPAETVAWPPERVVVMSVVGFREAAHTAIPIVVDEALTVPVVALAALSLLNLTAWLDRHQETDKDAIDLLTLLRLYHAAGNEDRLLRPQVGRCPSARPRCRAAVRSRDRTGGDPPPARRAAARGRGSDAAAGGSVRR